MYRKCVLFFFKRNKEKKIIYYKLFVVVGRNLLGSSLRRLLPNNGNKKSCVRKITRQFVSSINKIFFILKKYVLSSIAQLYHQMFEQ